MDDMTKEDFAGELDNEGFWYFFWQGFHRYYKDIIDPELYAKMEEFSKLGESLRKDLSDGGWLL